MEINAKFYKLKGIGELSFCCECVTTSINTIRSQVIDRLAFAFGYRKDTDIGILYDSKEVRKLREMNEEDLFTYSFNYSTIGINIVLPTMPKILLENIDDGDEFIKKNDCIDITDSIVKSIRDSIDINEIKEFVNTHSDDEISEKYCYDKNLIDMFWIL